jgi:hypothetical protein
MQKMKKKSSINNKVKDNINIPRETNEAVKGILDNNPNKIPENCKTILVQTLIALFRAGFRKLVPLFADSRRANVYDNLVNEQEIKQFPSAEGKPVRIIYENVNFWTEKRLIEKSHLFCNVATTFGLTEAKDSKDRPLYLYGVDVDSQQAYDALKDLIYTLKGITFVVKSHKEYGYHFYVLTPVLHEAMGRASFKLDAEIEIKTDMSLGTMHLPPSRHRKHPYWNYKRVSVAEQIYIDEEDKIFQQIITAMSSYIRKEPTEDDVQTLDMYPSQSNPPGHKQQQQIALQPTKSLSGEHIEKASEIILMIATPTLNMPAMILFMDLQGTYFTITYPNQAQPCW